MSAEGVAEQLVAPSVDGQTFRDAMALLAAPITVVTFSDHTGRRWGFTASSVTSVSLDPPLITVGVAHASSCYRALAVAPEFVVNVLSDRHRAVATRFAARGLDRFAEGGFVRWPGSMLPCLADAHLLLRCRPTHLVPVGDHDLLVGTPTEVRMSGPGKPLVWYRRDFHILEENLSDIRPRPGP
ncbi:flavin reductase family protein [Micromonospora sp. NPDC049044]|uniref:flavin reductase family protein n=1 Tax=unclassified Micromonospora TaxID=2617518 RepID=UPI0033DE0487